MHEFPLEPGEFPRRDDKRRAGTPHCGTGRKKTFNGVERTDNHPVETILQQIATPNVAKAPCSRFKEWTNDGKGLEYTLSTVVPPVPPNIVFGPFNFEREPVQMARCITTDLLLDRYGIEVEPGVVYSPTPHWWLLVTAPRVDKLLNPRQLLLCLESLRTSTREDLILCFHQIDWYRGKMKFRWWLELIITCFTSYPRIRLLDDWTHTFEEPLHVKATLSTLDTWVLGNVDNQALPRSVWQDLAAIQGCIPRVCLPPDNGPGREIVYPGNLRPNIVEYISYDTTDFLQAEGHITLACPADLETSSAALRYELRDCGREQVISLRPRVGGVGEILTLTPSITNKPSQTVHLMITRSNQRAPLIADDLLLCLKKLISWLEDRGITHILFSILDLERPVCSLTILYQVITDLFADTNIHVILHNRVYVSILGIETGVKPPKCHLPC